MNQTIRTQKDQEAMSQKMRSQKYQESDYSKDQGGSDTLPAE